MERIFDFIKAHPYITLNGICLFILVLCILFPGIGHFIILLPAIAAEIFFRDIIFSLSFILISGTAAFFFIKNNKTLPGIFFSLLFGSAGGFIAVNSVNKNFSKAVIINGIFNIKIWSLMWLAAVNSGIFGVIVFLIPVILILTAGGLALNAPMKIMLTVNISVSALTAAALLPATIMKFEDIVFSGSTLLLIGFMPLILLLPNFILFIKFRKHREPCRFESYITRSAFLLLCHIPASVLTISYFITLPFFIRF